MEEYFVVRKTDWNNVPFLAVEKQPWFSVSDIEMKMQLMWDNDSLYVHQIAKEPDIRAENKEHLSPVYEDSCMEFFIAPESGDSRYFNFELNPNGALMLGFGTGRNDRICLRPADPALLFDIETKREHESWETFYKIPVSFITTFFPCFSLKKGMTFMANCYKCGDKTNHVHYMSWNMMTSEKPDFHRFCDFGIMELI